MPASISSQHPESDFHALGNPSRFRWVGKRSITDPEGYAGERLRTLADRLSMQDKSLAAILAATDDVRQLIVGAACGSPPADPDAPNDQKKEWKKHGQRWFKSTAGGAELAEKMFAFGLWPNLSPQLLTFVNAVRTAVGLAAVQTVN
jgi:putative ATP-dependent endonuclease of OLD family